MKKNRKNRNGNLTLRTTTIRNLEVLAAAHGGLMALNPRTDCICCKACATMAC